MMKLRNNILVEFFQKLLQYHKGWIRSDLCIIPYLSDVWKEGEEDVIYEFMS